MAKKKLARFAEMEVLPNVFQPKHEEVFRTDYPLKGKWNEEVFHNDHPIILEIGCGKGEYTVELGKLYPEKNFIGLDIKGARMWKGAKTAVEDGMNNVAFLRMYAEMLESVFAPGEIAELWITFPDPQMAKARKRLSGTRFLSLYRKILAPQAVIHLKTDRTRTKSLHGEITRLRALLEAVGKTYKYPILENLIINRDIPPTARAEFRTYSDEELKRLNAEIVKMNEQIARLMILHQMLGTRISDTLTLRTDCLRGQPGDRVVHIRQMKTHPYEKPVSEEIAILIERSIQYTKKKWGETEYIFVSDSDPSLPAQYNRIQTQVVQMIREKDLRDDYGRLFGFGTHMYRHYYGVKLTEMHLDDWTIARLLGHSSVHNVKYYRKMSNQILADETRKVRERLSQLILENLDGWGEEYEQVRYDVSCK